jgi:dienelactone hydrolase
MERADQFEAVAQRVFALHAEQRYPEALAAAQEAGDSFPEHAARIARWTAALQCLAGEPAAALATLQAAPERGLWWPPGLLLDDADFAALRARPELTAIATACAELQRAARAAAESALVMLPPTRLSPSPPLLVALHGRWGNAPDSTVHWCAATGQGFLVALPQSSQLVGPDSFQWDDSDQTATDLDWAWGRIRAEHAIDRARVVLGGFSQGAFRAVEHALSGAPIPARGVIAVVPSIADPTALVEGAETAADRGVRVWLLTGERDPRRGGTEALHAGLRARGVTCDLVVVGGLGHAFPSDFPSRLPSALQFLRA